jgi:hypothetical protein
VVSPATPARGSTLRDGLGVGAIGAAVLALWMTGTDAVAGHPLATARLLGGAIAPTVAGDALAVLAQSRLGRMAWVQFGAGGVLTSIVMGWAVYRRHPAVRADWIRGRAEDA